MKTKITLSIKVGLRHLSTLRTNKVSHSTHLIKQKHIGRMNLETCNKLKDSQTDRFCTAITRKMSWQNNLLNRTHLEIRVSVELDRKNKLNMHLKLCQWIRMTHSKTNQQQKESSQFRVMYRHLKMKEEWERVWWDIILECILNKK